MNIGLLSRLPAATIVSATCIATQVHAADFRAAAITYTVQLRTFVSAAISNNSAANAQASFEGAGFVVDKERGWLLTNGRIFDNGIGKVEIAFPSHEFVGAKVKYVDPELNFSILVVKPNDLPPTATAPDLACKRPARTGTNVTTFGFEQAAPLIGQTGKVTQIAISEGQDSVQTDIPTKMANSGGPLVNQHNGKVVGVISTPSRRSNEGVSAVPIAPACKVIALLRQGLDPSPRELPFSFKSLPDIHSPLIITELASIAYQFGMRDGDRIIEANGLSVNTPTETATALRGSKGAAVFKLQSASEILTLSVPIGTEAFVSWPPLQMLNGAINYDGLPYGSPFGADDLLDAIFNAQ